MDFWSTRAPFCDPWKNFSSRFFLDILIAIDAVFHRLSEKRVDFVGPYNFSSHLVEIPSKNRFVKSLSSPFDDFGRIQN